MDKGLGNGIGSGIKILIFIGLVAGFALGQQSVVRGEVADGGGNPLSKVKATFSDKANGTRFSVKSGKDGKFVKIGIPPADYDVIVELEGYIPFKTELQLGIEDEKIIKVVLQKIPLKIEDDRGFAEGIDLYQRGKYQDAVQSFQKQAMSFPQNPGVYYNLGISYLRTNDVDRAIDCLNKARELKPDMIEVYLALGECYLAKSELDKAINAFEQALIIQPNSAPALYNIGLIYYKNDRTDDAISAFEKAVERNPELSSAYYQLGLAYIKKGDFKAAIRYLEEFLRREPEAKEASSVKTIVDELRKKIEKYPGSGGNAN